MSLWADRRKAVYTSFFILVLVIFVGIPIFLLVYEKPTCFDDKMNGDETGFDCGGSCVKLCQAEFVLPQVLWERSVAVVPGVYNLLAYAENPNLSVGAKSVPYVFRIYDNSGLAIAEKTGFTDIPSGKKFAVFYPTVSLGDRLPVKVTFEFTDIPKWEKLPPEIFIKTSNIKQISGDSRSRVEALVTNESLKPVGKTEIVVVVYDSNGNAMAFSRTVIDSLSPGRQYPVVFTWPTQFDDTASRVEILHRILSEP